MNIKTKFDLGDRVEIQNLSQFEHERFEHGTIKGIDVSIRTKINDITFKCFRIWYIVEPDNPLLFSIECPEDELIKIESEVEK